MTPDQTELINICLALLWLCGAILFARANRPEESYQLRRVPLAAGTFVAGIALIAFVLAALAGRLDILVFHYILGSVLILGMIAFLSALIVDVVAIQLRAARTPQWLAAGIVTAIVITYAGLFVIGEALWGAGPSPQSPAFFLPGPDRRRHRPRLVVGNCRAPTARILASSTEPGRAVTAVAGPRYRP